ncbi:MAG: protocatechuate 3,4-dioxygenase subunit beta [Cohaesibacteraceae bacterium]|nr:protocatechuate 3,4-dioxygenase subunit beta [Cohaesibacteraceae bacterium]
MTEDLDYKRDWTVHPPLIHPPYKSTLSRGPTKPLMPVRQSLLENSAPAYGNEVLGKLDADLTLNGRMNGEPLGERIIVKGRVRDEENRPVRNTLLEIWQANSAGRYIHLIDQHQAPLDPNFFGGGRTITDDDGYYEFLTIRPGAYPWGNHPNAWRPPHIHFSLFGLSFTQRLITQMYFPGDPLLDLDPIFQGTPMAARDLLISEFSIKDTKPDYALAYIFNITLRGRNATPWENQS